jgi:hypothetical protein
MNKIGVYEFLSFLLPGLLVSAAISFFFSYAVPVLPEGFRFEDLNTIGDSLIFLVIAYLIGHATQVFGNSFEVGQLKYWGKRPLRTAKHPEKKAASGFVAGFVSFWSAVLPVLRFVPWIKGPVRRKLGLVPNEDGGGWYSRQLLRPEDGTYNAETKKSIREAAEEVLGVPFAEESDCASQSEGSDRKTGDRKNQTIFDRAYRFILLKDVAPETKEFNSQYGFYRGNCVAFLFIRWISIVALVIFAVQFSLAWKTTKSFAAAWGEHSDHLISAIVVYMVFDVLFFLLRKRYERFAFYFANSVYQNFLVWWLSEKKPRQV